MTVFVVSAGSKAHAGVVGVRRTLAGAKRLAAGTRKHKNGELLPWNGNAESGWVARLKRDPGCWRYIQVYSVRSPAGGRR